MANECSTISFACFVVFLINGIISIYFGCDPNHVTTCNKYNFVSVFIKEIRKMDDNTYSYECLFATNQTCLIPIDSNTDLSLNTYQTVLQSKEYLNVCSTVKSMYSLYIIGVISTCVAGIFLLCFGCSYGHHPERRDNLEEGEKKEQESIKEKEIKDEHMIELPSWNPIHRV